MNATQIIAAAKANGINIIKSGKLNGATAYRIADAAKHGMATDPFGNSAALLTKEDISSRLGYGY